MYQKEQYTSLVYNPSREKQRPQTPGASGNQNYSQYNKSFTKNQNISYSPYKSNYQPANNYQRNPNVSKSRISVASSQSQLSFLNADQGEIFPEDLVFLLKNQQKNINNFKDKIQKQKSRVQNDFAVLKTQIEHILQDLKLSVQAQLDLVYKVFISKYAQVKGQVQQIRRLRKQILMANQVGSIPTVKSKDSSNIDIVSQIQKDAQHFRNYRVYGYLSEMQKQKLNPILQLCNQLILIGSIDSPFYRSKQMGLKHKDIKNIFSSSLTQVYQRLTDYVITPASIIEKEKQEEQNNINILRNLQQQNNNNEPYHQQNRQAFDNIYPQNKGFGNRGFQTSEFNKQFNKRKPQQQPNTWDNNNNMNVNNNIKNNQIAQNIPNSPPYNTTNKKSPITRVSHSEKCIVTPFAQSINLKKLQRVVTDHLDSILCIFFIDNRYIATGSKDKTINVYTMDGKKYTTLKGHQASICTLSTIISKNKQIYLASGSDHGCCCLILWDTRTWTISSRIQSHVAAVTSIVDLQDGEHLVTGSYDKKIYLYNYNRNQVLGSFGHKSAITSIVLTSDKSRLVSAGLDNSLSVWAITDTNNNLSLQLIRTINNNSMICVLQASLLRPQLIIGACRDGKIKTFNINSANNNQLQKIYTVNQNSIIQLVTIERQMKNNSPLILSCSAKDKSLCLTKMDNGISQLVKVNGAFNIQFGCGIGPKIVINPNGIMAILSQANNAKEFSLFQVQIR